MRYRAETFALYDALFTEAHQTLVKDGTIKEAGLFSRMGSGLKAMGEAWKSTSPKALHAAERATLNNQVGSLSQALTKQEAEHLALKATHDTAKKELQQFGADPGALTSAQRWKNLGLTGTVAGAAGIPAAYYAGQSGAEQKGRTSRNLAFGAGAAAGLAAPQLVTGLGAIANSAGQTGLFPELQGAGFGPNAPQGNY